MLNRIREVAEEVLEERGINLGDNDCLEEFRESARYYFSKDGQEYQISVNVTDDGENNIEWTFYSREEGREDWNLEDSDIVEE